MAEIGQSMTRSSDARCHQSRQGNSTMLNFAKAATLSWKATPGVSRFRPTTDVTLKSDHVSNSENDRFVGRSRLELRHPGKSMEDRFLHDAGALYRRHVGRIVFARTFCRPTGRPCLRTMMESDLVKAYTMMRQPGRGCLCRANARIRFRNWSRCSRPLARRPRGSLGSTPPTRAFLADVERNLIG